MLKNFAARFSPVASVRARFVQSMGALALVFGLTATSSPVSAAPSTVGTCDTASAVEVEATAGTLGPTGYTTLKGAFDAINAGTHQGAINIEICLSTTEGTTPATLNSNGAGAAVYTAVSIRPLVDGLTVSGNPVTGFGVIQLNGADNVTIDGDNPNTAGINRNLTVANTTTATVIANSAIRIATSAAVTSADNNTIKNCILNGNVTSGNASAITSATGSSNSSFGIYVGGNGGATATGAPTAITSVTTNTAPSGTTVNNLLIDNNAVNQAARAIVFNGAATTVSTGVTISNNTIGDQGTPTPATPPYTTPATTVYTKGIWVAGTSSISVTGNTIKNLMSYVATTITTVELVSPIGASVTISNNTITNPTENGATSAVKAILISAASGSYNVSGNTISNVQAMSGTSGTAAMDLGGTVTSGTVELNKITTVYNRNVGTFGATGLLISAGSNIVIRNNFISDVNMNMTGGAAFSTTFGVHGLRIAGGTGHKIYHNSVNLFGTLLGTSTTAILTSAFTVVGTGQTGLDVRNNIFSNNLSGGTTGVAHVSMFLPSSGTSGMNLTINNNDYFAGAIAGQSGIAHVGTTYTSPPAGPATYAGLYLATDYNPADTAATTNLRTYTNTLSLAGTNETASKVVDPLYSSNTDLHIAVASPMVDMGASVGVTIDIDSQLRVGIPDIGADEPSGLTPPPNDIAAAAFVSPPSGGTVGAGSAFTPQASFRNAGTATQTNVPVRFRITDALSSVVYNMTALIPSIAPGATTTVSFPSAVIPTAGNYTMTATSELVGDATPANDSISAALIVQAPISGSVNVGAGETFTSLTNPGGIFAALNAAGATSNVTVNITSDLAGETGSVALNELAGGFTVLIKPSGVARSITSTGTAIAVIKLNDADKVTIDGSLNGGADRSLTITNANTAASTAAIWVASLSNGAQNNTIKNTNLIGGADQSVISTFNFGIISSSSASILTGGTDNDGNTYTNNFIKKVSVGIISIGGLAANMNQSTSISGNLIGPAAFGVDEISLAGVLLFNENLPSVVGNEIRFIGDAATTGGSSGRDHVGIALGTTGAAWSGSTAPTSVAVTNAMVARNLIHDVVERGTFSAVGIVENSSNAGGPTNNVIANNMIYNIQANGTSGDQTVGIGISNGNGDSVVFNSVYLTGDIDPGASTAASTSSFGISVAFATPTNLTLKNNISVMDLNSNTPALLHSAINVIATTYAWGTGGSDFNNWFAPAANPQARVGTTAGSGGTFYATLAAWQAAVVQDASSKSVDPLFVSATNLHLQTAPTASPLIGVGTALAAVLDDIDGDLRPAIPSIGADEPAFGVLTIAPTSVNFGSQIIGSTSPESTVILGNTGTGPLNVTLLTVASAPFARTATGTCSATLPITIAGGSSCTLTFTFSPSALVSSSQNLTVFAGGAGNGTIGLQGTGVQGFLTISPPTLAFGSQAVNSTSATGTVTLSNTGTGSLNVTAIDAALAPFATVVGGTCTAPTFAIAAGGNCTLTYAFSPTVTGAASQTINVTSNAPGATSFAMTGTGTQGTLSITGSPVAFGNVHVGSTSTPITVTLTNTGNASLNVTSLPAPTAPFAIAAGSTCSGTSFPLGVGASCIVNYTFSPTTTGLATQNLAVTADSPGGGTIALSGTGILGNLVISPATVNFGTQGVSTTSPAMSATFTNSGTDTLNVISISAASAPFAAVAGGTCTGTAFSLAPLASCTVNYTFTPAATGPFSQTINVTRDSPGDSSFQLSGTGVQGNLSITPSTVDFLTQNVGSTSAEKFATLTNTGGATLNVTSITAASGAFARTGTGSCVGSAFSLGAGASCTLSYTFTPVAAGLVTQSISVTDDAGGNGAFQLSGTGLQGNLTIAPPAVNFPNQAVNTTSSELSVTLSNTGTASLTVNSVAAATTPFARTATGSCVGASFSIAAGTSCTLTYTFAPTAAVTSSQSIAVTANAPGGGSFTLNGTGILTPPTINAPANQTINEDGTTGSLTVTVGDNQTAAASLTLSVVSSSAPAIIPTANVVLGGAGASRTVVVTPVANANGGPVSITLRVTDGDGQTADGTFSVTVNPVNDVPSFTKGANQTQPGSTPGLKTVAAWATAISAGPANEAGQVLNFIVSEASDPNNIVSGTAVSATGTLTYTLSGVAGTATINVAVHDDGGTANGGVDTSANQTFTITVGPDTDLSIVKTASLSQLDGGLLQYTLVVSNLGQNPATGATVTDTFPAGLSGITWTCAITGGATCTASGSGNISQTVNLPAASTVTYSITATVALPVTASITNTATVTAPGGVPDINSANNTSTVVVTVPLFKDGFEDAGAIAQIVNLQSLSAGESQTLSLAADALSDLAIDQQPIDAIVYDIGSARAVVQTRRIGTQAQIRLLQSEAYGQWTIGTWTDFNAVDRVSFEWVRVNSAQASGALQSGLRIQK